MDGALFCEMLRKIINDANCRNYKALKKKTQERAIRRDAGNRSYDQAQNEASENECLLERNPHPISVPYVSLTYDITFVVYRFKYLLMKATEF